MSSHTPPGANAVDEYDHVLDSALESLCNDIANVEECYILHNILPEIKKALEPTMLRISQERALTRRKCIREIEAYVDSIENEYDRRTYRMGIVEDLIEHLKKGM